MNNLLVKVLKQENKKKNPLTNKDFLYYPDKKLLEIYLGKAKEINESSIRKKVSEVTGKILPLMKLDWIPKDLALEK